MQPVSTELKFIPPSNSPAVSEQGYLKNPVVLMLCGMQLFEFMVLNCRWYD